MQTERKKKYETPYFTQIPNDMDNWHITLNNDGIIPRYEFHQSESVKFPPCYQFGGPTSPHLLATFGHDPPKLKNTSEIQETNYLNLFLSLEKVPEMRDVLAKIDDKMRKWIIAGKFPNIKCRNPVEVKFYYKPLVKTSDNDKYDTESIRLRIYKKEGSTKIFVAKEDEKTQRKWLVRGNINNINYDAEIVPEIVISHMYFKNDKCGVILRSHRLVVFPGHDEKEERGMAQFGDFEMKVDEPVTNDVTNGGMNSTTNNATNEPMNVHTQIMPNSRRKIAIPSFQDADVEMSQGTSEEVDASRDRFLTQLSAGDPEEHQSNWFENQETNQ